MSMTTERATAAPPPGRQTSEVHHGWGMWLVLVMVVTILGGLLFGYDQGVISGALTFVKDDFSVGTTAAEIITSWVTLGALVGALVAGTLADAFGRRMALIIAGLLFVGGALIQAISPDIAVLVLGRCVIGLGVGVASVAAPLYAAEMSPAQTRGQFVSSYQLAITIGIFLAYVIDDLLTESENWRLMFAVAIVPGAALMLMAFVMPETPRWLLKMGNRDAALQSTTKISGAGGAQVRLDKIQADLDADQQQAGWAEVFAPKVRRMLWVGIGLAIFQQVTGINAIIYYANEIFGEAGFVSDQAKADATLWAVGAVNVLATFIAIAFVDRFGRRPLLFAGLVGMFVSLTAVGLAFLSFDESSTGGGEHSVSVVGIITLICLVVYISSFAFSLGPIVWTIIAEIFPNRVRGKAVAVATAVNWLSAFIVSQFFLTLIDEVGSSATFWLFAGMCAVAFVWIAAKVPETKGRSLEEISEAFDEHDAERAQAKARA